MPTIIFGTVGSLLAGPFYGAVPWIMVIAGLRLCAFACRLREDELLYERAYS